MLLLWQKGLIFIDTRNLQILLDIQSLQSFGSVQSALNQTQPSSLFSSMLEEMLGNSLGNVADSVSNGAMDREGLHYSGANRIFEPAALPAMLTATQNIPAQTSKYVSNQGGQYTDIIKQAAEQYNLPSGLLDSIIRHESNFNKDAVSHAGAQGLMQLMPGTARFLGVKDSFDPAQNIRGGARYLRQMLDQFNGNIEHALAAYNAGPGNVRKHGGIPPFKETQSYVQKVLNTFRS